MSDCIFCKIVVGEIPSYCLYEDDDFKVILDRFPSSVGHTLVLTKKHFDNLYDIDPDTAGKLFQLAARLAPALKDGLGCDGLNLLQNNGRAAGQTVEHLHLHLIPRYEGDKLKMGWATMDPSKEAFQEVLSKVKLAK